MSEDMALSSEEQSNQTTKRRKRSGWDIQTPIADNTIPITNVVPTQQHVHQQTQLTQYGVSPMITLQQAQQMNLMQMQQPSIVAAPLVFGGGAVSLGGVPSLAGLPAQAPKLGCRIYIGSINYDIKESDMIALFSSFGTITKSEMSIDPITGKSKGFCFIEYADVASAEASQAMDGFELAGRKMKVGRPFHGEGAVPALPGAMILPGGGAMMSGPNIMTSFLTTGSVGVCTGLGGLPLTSIPAASYGLPMMSGMMNPSQIPMMMQPYEADKKNCLLVSNVKADTPITDLEKIFKAFGSISSCQYAPPKEEASNKTKQLIVEYIETANAFSTSLSMNNFELGGLTLKCEVIANSAARQLLQPKPIPSNIVSTNNNISSAKSSNSTSSSNINPNNYKVLLLNNMITIEDAKDPELKDEISEEATNYGELVNIDIIVHESEQKAIVKLYFNDSISAGKAFKAMNNRVFAGNTINAILLPE